MSGKSAGMISLNEEEYDVDDRICTRVEVCIFVWKNCNVDQRRMPGWPQSGRECHWSGNLLALSGVCWCCSRARGAAERPIESRINDCTCFTGWCQNLLEYNKLELTGAGTMALGYKTACGLSVTSEACEIRFASGSCLDIPAPGVAMSMRSCAGSSGAICRSASNTTVTKADYAIMYNTNP